jgi:hypothetical protein
MTSARAFSLIQGAKQFENTLAVSTMIAVSIPCGFDRTICRKRERLRLPSQELKTGETDREMSAAVEVDGYSIAP